MATHSSVLAWRIPGKGEPGELPSMGSHRVGHDWSDLAAAAAATWQEDPATATAKSLQSCPTLCNPTDGGPPGSPVPGTLQARTLEWVAISFSNAWKGKSEVAQSCPTLRDPVDCSPPGSSVYGIFQARILEWIAISFSGGCSWPRKWIQVSCIAGRFFTDWATREALIYSTIIFNTFIFISGQLTGFPFCFISTDYFHAYQFYELMWLSTKAT